MGGHLSLIAHPFERSRRSLSARRCGTYKDEDISEARQNDHLAIFVQCSVAHLTVRRSSSVVTTKV